MKSIRLFALTAAVAAGISCGSVIRDGRAPVYLVVQSLQAQRGGGTAGAAAAGVLQSDVLTNVITPAPCSAESPCPTVFNDVGSATLSVALKNIGSSANPASPTTNNDVTITRYHVEYVRTDGRNTQGVDVPYAFDGATAATITAGQSASVAFELVRNSAKEQAPLIQLAHSATILTTLANVTFYGHDQVGNELNVTGSITVEFGNFGD